MADQIEQINKILSVPTEGTGDNVYEGAGAIDPREVGVDALNAGALTDEEFMMAEEFMDSLPPEDKPGFMELFMTKPREALNAVMDTLRQVFDREDEPDASMGADAPMGALGGIGSGSTSNAELDAMSSGIIKGAMSDNEKGFAMSTALPQGLTDEQFQSFMDKKYAAQKRMKEQMLNN